MEDLVLSCLESRVEANRTLYARFLVGPFLKGDALTVATALRRVLLSSVESIGITALYIQGITHEFSTIGGVRESVLELSLNFQAIVLCYDKNQFQNKDFFDDIQIGYLQVQGPKIVYANDLKLPLGVKLVDPTQYIATVAKEGSIILKFVIGKRNNLLRAPACPVHVVPGNSFSYGKMESSASCYTAARKYNSCISKKVTSKRFCAPSHIRRLMCAYAPCRAVPCSTVPYPCKSSVQIFDLQSKGKNVRTCKALATLWGIKGQYKKAHLPRKPTAGHAQNLQGGKIRPICTNLQLLSLKGLMKSNKETIRYKNTAFHTLESDLGFSIKKLEATLLKRPSIYFPILGELIRKNITRAKKGFTCLTINRFRTKTWLTNRISCKSFTGRRIIPFSMAYKSSATKKNTAKRGAFSRQGICKRKNVQIDCANRRCNSTLHPKKRSFVLACPNMCKFSCAERTCKGEGAKKGLGYARAVQIFSFQKGTQQSAVPFQGKRCANILRRKTLLRKSSICNTSCCANLLCTGCKKDLQLNRVKRQVRATLFRKEQIDTKKKLCIPTALTPVEQPKLHFFTTSKKSRFLSKNKVFKSNIGLRNIIPLDLTLTPILKVNFVIEIDDEVLYLRQKIRERIILEVWTNGSIHPRQAVHNAALSLTDIFTSFRSVYQVNSYFLPLFKVKPFNKIFLTPRLAKNGQSMNCPLTLRTDFITHCKCCANLLVHKGNTARRKKICTASVSKSKRCRVLPLLTPTRKKLVHGTAQRKTLPLPCTYMRCKDSLWKKEIRDRISMVYKAPPSNCILATSLSATGARRVNLVKQTTLNHFENGFKREVQFLTHLSKKKINDNFIYKTKLESDSLFFSDLGELALPVNIYGFLKKKRIEKLSTLKKFSSFDLLLFLEGDIEMFYTLKRLLLKHNFPLFEQHLF